MKKNFNSWLTWPMTRDLTFHIIVKRYPPCCIYFFVWLKVNFNLPFQILPILLWTYRYFVMSMCPAISLPWSIFGNNWSLDRSQKLEPQVSNTHAVHPHRTHRLAHTHTRNATRDQVKVLSRQLLSRICYEVNCVAADQYITVNM